MRTESATRQPHRNRIVLYRQLHCSSPSHVVICSVDRTSPYTQYGYFVSLVWRCVLQIRERARVRSNFIHTCRVKTWRSHGTLPCPCPHHTLLSPSRRVFCTESTSDGFISYLFRLDFVLRCLFQLTGRINKCGVISPRFDMPLHDTEKWVNNLLPARGVSSNTAFPLL